MEFVRYRLVVFLFLTLPCYLFSQIEAETFKVSKKSSIKCLLIQESYSQFDTLGKQLEDGIYTVQRNNYHFNKQGKIDTISNSFDQDTYWEYKKDTIVSTTSPHLRPTTSIYLLNKAGNVQAMHEIIYENVLGTDPLVIDSSVCYISNIIYKYDSLDQLIETNKVSSFASWNSVIKFKWLNGNIVEREMYDSEDKLIQNEVYEYYSNLPYQNLLPLQPVKTGIELKNLVKSIIEKTHVLKPKMVYNYEFNNEGLVIKQKRLEFWKVVTVSEYTYKCK